MKREEVARQIGVHPNTILNWEKRRVSPVVPLRNPRTGRLTYPDDAPVILSEWMHKLEPATFGDQKE